MSLYRSLADKDKQEIIISPLVGTTAHNMAPSEANCKWNVVNDTTDSVSRCWLLSCYSQETNIKYSHNKFQTALDKKGEFWEVLLPEKPTFIPIMTLLKPLQLSSNIQNDFPKPWQQNSIFEIQANGWVFNGSPNSQELCWPCKRPTPIQWK